MMRWGESARRRWKNGSREEETSGGRRRGDGGGSQGSVTGLMLSHRDRKMVGMCTAQPALETHSVSGSTQTEEIKGGGGKVEQIGKREHDGGMGSGGWKYDRRPEGIKAARTEDYAQKEMKISLKLGVFWVFV